MNKQTEALKMAIEALQNVYFENEQLSFVDNAESNWKQRQNAIQACKEALEGISKTETTTQTIKESLNVEALNEIKRVQEYLDAKMYAHAYLAAESCKEAILKYI